MTADNLGACLSAQAHLDAGLKNGAYCSQKWCILQGMDYSRYINKPKGKIIQVKKNLISLAVRHNCRKIGNNIEASDK